MLEHEGRRLTQSGAILELPGRTPSAGSAAPGEDERREILRWILFDNHKFTSYAATLPFPGGFAKSGDPAVLEFLMARIAGAYAVSTGTWRSASSCRRETDHRRLLPDRLPVLRDDFGHRASELAEPPRWTQRIAPLPRWKHPYDLMPRDIRNA